MASMPALGPETNPFHPHSPSHSGELPGFSQAPAAVPLVVSGKTINTRTAGDNNSLASSSRIMIEESLDRTSPPSAPSRMLRRQATRLFPLHLAPIDAFFLADDTDHYPMTSVIHLDFAGEVQRGAFEAALEEAMFRHPLTAAVLRPAKRGEVCWVQDPMIHPQVQWLSAGEPLRLANRERIELDREAGIRIWARTDTDSTRVTLQVHHACTDGTGVYRFLGDLLALYGIRTAAGEAPPVLEPLDPMLLRDRRRRMANIAISASRLRWILSGLREGAHVFGKRIKPLREPLDEGGSSASHGMPKTEFPGIESAELTREEHQGLRDVASKHGAMLNDLLMAEMFRTIVEWNESEGDAAGNPWLRIMMPFDLREQREYTMPAANMTAYTFVDRRRSACRDLPTLLRSIREETNRIKHDRAGTRFVDAMMLADTCRGLLPWLLRRQQCMSTVTLSNIGDPSKRFVATFPRRGGRIVCGDLMLDDVTGVPPLRQKMRATCALFSYLRKLTISVRCDPYTFTPEDTRKFLDTYVHGLRSHLAG